jgi:regulator of cell morphogenesis and NO signaling
MVSTAQTLIRDVVADDFRTAAVFQRHGLDFCCGGGRSIAEASHAKGIDPDVIMGELTALPEASSDDAPTFNTWELDLLVDYIVDNHHRFVRRLTPALKAYTEKVARVHGANHPETIRIAELFNLIAADLTMHMQKEENILFPYIKALAKANRTGAPLPVPFFGSIENPIRMMEAEHADAGNDMEQIHTLSGGFIPPEDACTTFRVSYQELQAFERDLHLHVHLENNILFPKAIELERQLRAGAALSPDPCSHRS